MPDDPRYPYTHAADYIRMLAGYGDHGTKLSRADASHIRSTIADLLGLDDYEVACKLADAELVTTEEQRQTQCNAILESIERGRNA